MISLRFPHYWPFVRGIHRWPVESPDKGSVISLLFLFIYYLRLHEHVIRCCPMFDGRRRCFFNSLVLGGSGCDFKNDFVLLMWYLQTFFKIMRINECHESYLWQVNIGSGNGLVPSGKPSQCLPSFRSPYGVTRLQWVNLCIFHYSGKQTQVIISENVTICFGSLYLCERSQI